MKMRWFRNWAPVRFVSRKHRNLTITLLVTFLVLYLFFVETRDGIMSDPRNAPVFPGACPHLTREMWLKTSRNTSLVQPGGHFKPQGCIGQQAVAIIVPYRDREEHRKIFLEHMHLFLQAQQLEYVIYIVEQDFSSKFNRGILVNIGFQFAMESGIYFSCIVVHDVDLIPADDRNLYLCSNNPRHMSSANSKFRYQLPYPRYVGGVISFTPQQYRDINGFSNVYFGWGMEDDDLRLRIYKAGYEVERVPFDIGVFEALDHPSDVDNFDRLEIFYHAEQRLRTDGLNSLKYEMISTEKRPLYTWINVQVKEKDYDTKPVFSFITRYLFTLRPCIFNYFLC